MTAIEDIPPAVLAKIKEYAFLEYKVKTVTELKAKIVDERFEEIINEYLGDVMLRIIRKKTDEAKAYHPTNEELVAYLQTKIDAKAGQSIK